MNMAIEFYQANKAALESEDCKDAHEYINANSTDNAQYVNWCNHLLSANKLSRDDLINTLSNNDRNGIYSDQRSIDEGYPIATKADLLLSVAICELEL
jgi:hypothetical protein